MRTTRAPNNGKNAPPVRACRFARACIAREDRPRRGKAPWQTARFACRLARCACRSSSQKSHFAAIFGSPIFFPSWVSAVYLTFRQRQRGVKQRPAVFLCCGMGICKRSATVCKIEVPGPCGPDTPNVCKKPFCVCKIDVVMLRSAARGGLPKSETTFPLPRGAALMRVRGRKGMRHEAAFLPFPTIYQSSCAM